MMRNEYEINKNNIENDEDKSKKQEKKAAFMNADPLAGIKRRRDFIRRQSVIHVEGVEMDIDVDDKF
jgi:hypothetical protein